MEAEGQPGPKGLAAAFAHGGRGSKEPKDSGRL